MKKHYRKIIYNTKKEKKHCRRREKKWKENWRLEAGSSGIISWLIHLYMNINQNTITKEIELTCTLKKSIKNVENEMKLMCNKMMPWILISQEMNMTAEIPQNNY